MNRTRFTFGRAKRLRGRGTFRAVIGARARIDADAISVHAAANGLSHHRLGISIGRKVGCAAHRNRIKRMLREAFRLEQHALPSGEPGPYDLVVTVRPHEPLPLEAYRSLLVDSTERLHATWRKRTNRRIAKHPPVDGSGSQPAG